MARQRTTRNLYIVQGAYGCGWEDVTAAETQRCALQRLAEYRENEPEYPHRLITRREKITS